jgi:flavorubredoxin
MTPTFIKHIERLDILEEIEPTKLLIPEGFGPIIAKNDSKLVAKKIAQDLYLVTDSSAWRNNLFKVNGDKIMVFGAPGNPERAEQTIKLIIEQFPKKQITSVYITHPHSDHIASLSAYAKLGVTIRADAYSIAAIKAYIPFAGNISSFKFEAIEHNQIIDGVRFYVLKNTHSKQQSFVYFKDLGVIYQADFFEVAFDNSIAKVLPSYTKTFIDFIRGKQLKFSRMVSHHYNNNISPKIMDTAYDTHMMKP